MSCNNNSKYTFVSKTFASIKDDPSVIHIVPTIAEIDKKWESRPITNPFQFSQKWCDMVDDDDDDDEFLGDPSDFKYFESFMVGTIPPTEPVVESNDNLDSNIVKSEDSISDDLILDSLPSFNNYQAVENIDSVNETNKFDESIDLIGELSAIIKEMKNEINFEGTNVSTTTTNSLSCSEITDIFLNTNDISNSMSNPCINSSKDNIAEENKTDSVSENHLENFLSYTDENNEKTIIPLSFEQVDEILKIINGFEKTDINSEELTIPLNDLSFGQLKPHDLFEFSSPIILSGKNINENQQNENSKTTICNNNIKNVAEDKNTLNIKNITQVNNIENSTTVECYKPLETIAEPEKNEDNKTKSIKKTGKKAGKKAGKKNKKRKNKLTKKNKKSIEKHSVKFEESKENLDIQEKVFTTSNITESLPLSVTKSNKLNSLRINDCNETKKVSKDIANIADSVIPSSPSKYSLVLNENLDIFEPIPELSEQDVNDSSLTFEYSQVFDDSVDRSFEEFESINNNTCLSMVIPNSQDESSRSLPMNKKNKFWNKTKMQLKNINENVFEGKIGKDSQVGTLKTIFLKDKMNTNNKMSQR